MMRRGIDDTNWPSACPTEERGTSEKKQNAQKHMPSAWRDKISGLCYLCDHLWRPSLLPPASYLYCSAISRYLSSEVACATIWAGQDGDTTRLRRSTPWRLESFSRCVAVPFSSNFVLGGLGINAGAHVAEAGETRVREDSKQQLSWGNKSGNSGTVTLTHRALEAVEKRRQETEA